MSSRTSTTLITRSEFDARVDKVAQLLLRRKQLTVRRDTRKEILLEHYNKQIAALDLELKATQAEAQAYAMANREEMFSKAKSAESPLATYGFRNGQPTLKKLSKDKEAVIAEQLYKDGHTTLVEAKFKLNKKAILAAVKEGLTAVAKLFGSAQKERFFIEAKALKKDMA